MPEFIQHPEIAEGVDFATDCDREYLASNPDVQRFVREAHPCEILNFAQFGQKGITHVVVERGPIDGMRFRTPIQIFRLKQRHKAKKKGFGTRL